MTPGELEDLLLSDTENDVDPAELRTLLRAIRRNPAHAELDAMLARVPVRYLRQAASRTLVCEDCELTIGLVIVQQDRLTMASRRRDGTIRTEWTRLRGESAGGAATMHCRRTRFVASSSALLAAGPARIGWRHADRDALGIV